MAASTARKVAAVLFAVAMVGSVAVGPALADDEDVSVGDDGVNVGGDDGATVSVGDDDDANGSATVDPSETVVNEDRAGLYWTTGTAADEDGFNSPGSDIITLVILSRSFSLVQLEATGTDGRSQSGGEAMAAAPTTQPNEGQAEVSLTAFDRSAGLSIDCDGSECKPKGEGVPSGDAIPAFPAGGGDDDDGGPEFDPSADTDEPETSVGANRVGIYDDSGASLGEGLPAADNTVLILRSGSFILVQQDAEASQGDNQVNADGDYTSGENPGDDDARVVAKANGAGVVAGFECDDYRCTPTQGTGVYAGPAGMLFEMLPDNPIEE